MWPVAGVSVARTAGTEGDEAAVSSKLFRCACVRRWLPLAYREELYQVLRLTGPLLLSRVLYFLLPFVSTIFCGHIGNAELAGYALASATVAITTTATGYGFVLACDTLISQTFGSKNMKRVGVILQRSSLILLFLCLPCWGLLINTQNLLLFTGVLSFSQICCLSRTCIHNIHGIILPQLYTAAAANIFNLGANYVLIFSLELGVVGSAIAHSLSQIATCLLLFGYIRWKKLHQQTWEGWSTECLQEWGSYMKLAIPSTFMVCFEWWIWEIGGFLAGVLGEDDLAAQHVLLELGTLSYMFPLGVHAAACVRVGNALGAGNTTRAILTCKVALVLSGVLAVFQGIVIAGCKSVLGYIFTSDEKIVEIVSENLTVYTFLQFFDALLCVCSGILVGSGMQKIAALSNLVCYYCIGLPVGIALMFAAKLRILGLWLGLLICAFLETGFFLFLIYKLNWKKITHKVGCSYLSLNHAQLDTEKAPKADGYSPVNTQDQEVKAGHEAEANNTNTKGAEGDAEQRKKTSSTKTQALLSVSELILRRGLIFLVSVLILAIGVAFHIAFPVPEPSAHSRANFTLNRANDSSPTPTPLAPTPNL
uniref:Multidrug and toxin extrusion protein n=1 Tax=Sander lucioperca TaxID=283035 RepID=A0A8D0D114_SANLU